MRLRLILFASFCSNFALASALGQSPPMVNSAYDRVFSGTQVNHTFTQTGGTAPITWDNFTFEGYTPAGSHVGVFFPATFDPQTQLFNWYSSGGQQRAEYVWSVRASNEAGNSTGTITIQTYIPEPASATLVALALMGLAGMVRRRRP